LIEVRTFHLPRVQVETEPARRMLPALSEVSFTSDEGVLRGWYVPGTSRAAVLLLHGSGGSRQELLPEMRILSERGIAVLAFDLPAHGQSDGEMQHWDEPERHAVERALDFLETREGIDPERIGAFGFSLGSYTLLQVAASDARVRAVAVAGAPSNIDELGRYQYRHYGVLGGWGAHLAARACGMHTDTLIPEQIVAAWSPRPLLVIEGDQDPVVPPHLARKLFDAARQPKQWLAVPGAEHGNYASVAPDLYGKTLGDFFALHLLSGRAGALSSSGGSGHS
jgi:pimeloyl-ACP methyl ester carboxylesterase